MPSIAHLLLLLVAPAALATVPRLAVGQYDPGAAVGQYYSIAPPLAAERVFDAVLVERVAPHSLAFPAPLEAMRIRGALSALTGQIIELPERQRLYFTAADARGALRLIEIDLLTRESRELLPEPGIGVPYAVHMLPAPDASKLYIQWFAAGMMPRTDIYDGATLRWLGHVSEFRPDERALGFEHQAPFMWTLDLANRPVLVDTHRDRAIRTFDLERAFGPVHAVIADGWGDLLLARLEVGHDRYHIVDTVSGEIGPALNLDGYRHAQPRLAFGGRLLVLIDMERRRPSRAQRWRETAVATGGGGVYDLQSGQHLEEFNLIVPHEFPVSAVGTTPDPGLPSRLWIHVPGDDERLDFSLPACGRDTPRGDRLAATVAAIWDGDNPNRYRYRVTVGESSEQSVGALAIDAGRETDRTAKPDGWGVDLIKDDRWVRWTNGLGPAAEDVAPGTTRGAFVVAANQGTRPGVGEFRLQAAIGLPRGCQSDDGFLENSLRGYTVTPEPVTSVTPIRLAERLERLVDRVCDVGWVAARDCPPLRDSAAMVSAQKDRASAVHQFLTVLAASRLTNDGAKMVLTDAAMAVRTAPVP
jgi:hypothetical protein